MRKNGIKFNFQEQKFHQGAYCFICEKKIEKGTNERISESSPYMHLCLNCSVSNKNIPPKKGASIKYNGRVYMWVGKGIRGDHTCDLTGKEIKNGTPCWWSSTKDDPNSKTESYVLAFELENPNEFEYGEKTELFSFKNDIVKIDDKVYIDEKPEKEEDIEPWYDENHKPITEVHMENDIKSFFEQVYGEGYMGNVKIFTKNKHEPFVGLVDYVKEILPQDEIKKYFVFWQDKNAMGDAVIKITNRDKIFQQIKFIGQDNVMKPISEIKMCLPDMICEKYEKVDGKWLRRD